MDNIITNVDGVKVKVRVYDFGDEVADRYTMLWGGVLSCFLM